MEIKTLKPQLYLVATPIGNMEDITLRAINVLRGCDVVFCEDTRHTATLLNFYDIKKPLVSCHEHNENARAEEAVLRVRSGEAVAFVSDAGMPGISDPGERLVKTFIKEEMPYTVLPGASASLTALVLSGLPVQNTSFYGFLPRENKQRREAIASLARHTGSLVIYESPKRVADTLLELSSVLGDRPAALVREITKLYEETLHGTLDSLADKLQNTAVRGECVLVIGGFEETQNNSANAADMLVRLLDSGVAAKDAAKQVSAVLDVPRNEAYELAIQIKNQKMAKNGEKRRKN